jgi:hypothetical protein
MITKATAVLSLVPGAEISVIGDEIVWSNPSSAPVTDEQISAEFERLKSEHDAAEYKRKRAAEYPDFREYLDGIVKGDNAQVQAYVDACLAIKAKHPKP